MDIEYCCIALQLTHLRNSGSSSAPYLFLYSAMTWCDQMAGRGTSPSNLHSIVSPMFLVSHLQMAHDTALYIQRSHTHLRRGVALTDWL